MTTSAAPPAATQRLAAAASFVLLAVVAVVTVVRVVDDLGRVTLELVLLTVLLVAGWLALTRSGRARAVAAVAAVAPAVFGRPVLVADPGGYIASDGPRGGAQPTTIVGSREVELAAGDYVEFEVYQDTGGALNVSNATASIRKVSN